MIVYFDIFASSKCRYVCVQNKNLRRNKFTCLPHCCSNDWKREWLLNINDTYILKWKHSALYFLCSFWRPLTPQLKQRCLRREKRWSASRQFWGKSQKPLTRCSTRQSHRSTQNTLKSMWWPSIPPRWHHKRLVVPIFFLLWRGLTWQYLGYFSMHRVVWVIWCLLNKNWNNLVTSNLKVFFPKIGWWSL